MVELWQAVILAFVSAFVGAAMSIGGAFIQRQWMRSDTAAAEERETRRRIELEQREVIRRSRRERVAPILDFLDAVNQAQGRRFAQHSVDTALREGSKGLDESAIERQRAAVMNSLPDEPSVVQLASMVSVALGAAPTEDIMRAIARLQTAATDAPRKAAGVAISDSANELRELVERYVAEV